MERQCLGGQRAFEQFEILRHHRVAVFGGDFDACGADSSAFLDSTKLVERLGQGIVGSRVGGFHRNALLKGLVCLLEVVLFHVCLFDIL